MSRRIFVVAAAAVVFAMSPWFNRTASAQDTLLDQAEATMLFVSSNPAPADAPALADAPQIPYKILHGRPEVKGANKALFPLYASVAALQILDVHSTLTAMHFGAHEGNPLMSGVTSTTPGFLAVKAGIAAATIMAAKSIAKRNKVAAIVTLIGINSAYGFVVSHNYKLAQSLQ
jgi:hypothetical protein